MGEPPKYLMRFVGFKEDGSGELKPTSPAGYARDQLLELPFDYSLEPWWEIVDDIPDLVLPDEDSEASVFEAKAEDGEISSPQKFVLPVEQAPQDVYVIDYESMTVPTLKHFIDQRGGKVERGWLKADLIEKARELEEAIRAREHEEEPGVGEDVEVLEGKSEVIESHTGEPGVVVSVSLEPDEEDTGECLSEEASRAASEAEPVEKEPED
ncbi:hypothetical protein LCGC14_2831230 [marine sediment metagenome]|uniref:Uncharacterized protein n=1 Tax=marine sediment metagenome TaxID=412755 RepID=A0A0F9AMG4_9ZZZZ